MIFEVKSFVFMGEGWYIFLYKMEKEDEVKKLLWVAVLGCFLLFLH